MSIGMRNQMSRFLGNNETFPDPFLDVATAAMPQSMRNALYWAEYIFQSCGTFRMAMERVLSYFITDVEFGDSDAGEDEKDKWKEVLTETLAIPLNTQTALRNRLAYGNSFISLLVPFKRHLACPQCGSLYPLRVMTENAVFKFSWTNMEFHATCPKCSIGSGYTGKWRVDDKPDNEEKNLKFKHWNPHEIELLHDYYTDDVAYLWRIPEDYKSQIRRGHLYHLERVSMPVLEAIRHNQMFRFHQDVLYHMKEPSLAGVRNRGWGIPRILTNFRQIYYVQVLRRYNEAIALDYVIPFRLITPAPRPGAGGGGAAGAQTLDPLMSFNMGDFNTQVRQMLGRRRRDPASWNVLPFPVQYQMLGGDANALAPVDLINQGTEQLLNDAGTPVELYKGTLQLQAAPVSLRLFESTWQPLVYDANNFLRWVERQLVQVMSWQPVNSRFKRVTTADDINKQMALLQLMMGQQASGTTAFKALGLDWRAEQRQIGEEARYQAEQQARVQEEMDQAGFASEIAKGNIVPGSGGAPAMQPPGGMPMGGGGAAGGGGGAGGAMPGSAMAGPVSQYLSSMGPNTPITPQDMMQAADMLANGLMGMPEGQKDSELRMLKQKNEVMHSLVRAKIDQIRRNARNQGGQQVMGSTFGVPR